VASYVQQKDVGGGWWDTALLVLQKAGGRVQRAPFVSLACACQKRIKNTHKLKKKKVETGDGFHMEGERVVFLESVEIPGRVCRRACSVAASGESGGKGAGRAGEADGRDGDSDGGVRVVRFIRFRGSSRECIRRRGNAAAVADGVANLFEECTRSFAPRHVEEEAEEEADDPSRSGDEFVQGGAWKRFEPRDAAMPGFREENDCDRAE
jgi:hypothetical protein